MPHPSFPTGVRTLFALALAAALSSPAAAEFKLTTEREYYDVAGATAEDLERQMYREGRERTGCSKCYAHTRWKVRWRYKYEKRDGACALTRVRVTAQISYVLPRWPGRETGAAELREKWLHMIEALTAHEENHGKNGIETAEKVERALLALPPAPDCDSLKDRISETADGLIAKGNAWDDEYDRLTGHGRTEGADLE